MANRDGQNWNRQEVLIAFNLYCRTPFGKLNASNPEIIRLAALLERTIGSIVRKMGNLASHDLVEKERGITGLTHSSKIDKQVWDEFHETPTEIIAESEALVGNLEKQKQEGVSEPRLIEPIAGREKQRIIDVRENQGVFRKILLAIYDKKCCITGIPVSDLLTASHIKPWKRHIAERLDPENGVLLNALHDRAFDRGLITITPDYKVKISNVLREKISEPDKLAFINKYDGKGIKLPEKFLPKREFLAYHNECIFKG